MKLYFSNGSCSLASHQILEESGAKFEAQRLNLREGDQRKPEYLKLNPKGKVPTLELDDGTVITENPAIISWIADSHPQANLLAKPGELQRAKAQEWLAWCASAVHPSFGVLFGATRTKIPADETQRSTVQSNLDLFDRWLGGKSFVLGEQFSAADAYTIVFYQWAKNFSLQPGESHQRSVRALLQRPGIQRALDAHDLKVSV
jgi:glutathione S-transferase